METIREATISSCIWEQEKAAVHAWEAADYLEMGEIRCAIGAQIIASEHAAEARWRLNRLLGVD